MRYALPPGHPAGRGGTTNLPQLKEEGHRPAEIASIALSGAMAFRVESRGEFVYRDAGPNVEGSSWLEQLQSS